MSTAMCYYNLKHSSWEPVMEQTTAQLSLERTVKGSSGDEVCSCPCFDGLSTRVHLYPTVEALSSAGDGFAMNVLALDCCSGRRFWCS